MWAGIGRGIYFYIYMWYLYISPFRIRKGAKATFFSKKTAQAFNELTTKYKLQKHLRNISCVSLSKEIEKLLKKNNFKKYYLCSNPDRESFLKLLKFINQNMI